MNSKLDNHNLFVSIIRNARSNSVCIFDTDVQAKEMLLNFKNNRFIVNLRDSTILSANKDFVVKLVGKDICSDFLKCSQFGQVWFYDKIDTELKALCLSRVRLEPFEVYVWDHQFVQKVDNRKYVYDLAESIKYRKQKELWA